MTRRYQRSIETMQQDILRRKQAHDGGFDKNERVVTGVVFSVGGSIYVPNTGESRVWVRRFNVPESQAQAYRGNILVLDGTPVMMKPHPKGPFIYQIVDINSGEIDPFTMNLIVRHTIGQHAANHQIPTEALIGPDPVYIYQAALKELRSEADDASLDITVQPHVYWNGGAFSSFPGAIVDMTSSVPGAGNIRKTLIYLELANNQIKIVDGTEVLNNGIIPVPRPNLPVGGRANAFIELVAAQTAIVQSTDIEHARDFLYNTQTALISAPIADGHILIGNEGSWISVLPMLDEDANIMTDEDSQIMWVG